MKDEEAPVPSSHPYIAAHAVGKGLIIAPPPKSDLCLSCHVEGAGPDSRRRARPQGLDGLAPLLGPECKLGMYYQRE